MSDFLLVTHSGRRLKLIMNSELEMARGPFFWWQETTGTDIVRQ